jgi:hypothetical protein
MTALAEIVVAALLVMGGLFGLIGPSACCG